MILVAMIAIGRCCSGPVRRRSWLGLAGVVLVVLAGLAAYGINSGFGEATHGALEEALGGIDIVLSGFRP